MIEEIYRTEYLRDKVTGLLRTKRQALTKDAIAAELGLPLYAVEAGLMLAKDAGLAKFNSPDGWEACAGVPI